MNDVLKSVCPDEGVLLFDGDKVTTKIIDVDLDVLECRFSGDDDGEPYEVDILIPEGMKFIRLDLRNLKMLKKLIIKSGDYLSERNERWSYAFSIEEDENSTEREWAIAWWNNLNKNERDLNVEKLLGSEFLSENLELSEIIFLHKYYVDSILKSEILNPKS